MNVSLIPCPGWSEKYFPSNPDEQEIWTELIATAFME